MLKAVLFDLDDTLLGNDIDQFIPHYFALLGEYAARYLDKQQFLQELMAGTQAMIASTDTAVSNRDVFWQLFQQRTGLDPAELEPFFDDFYRGAFEQLRPLTQARAVARDLVRQCLDNDLQVVVATNPLFPKVAIEARLRWAGLPPSEYPFALITAYENMHATKPNPTYYREILTTIDCEPATALMVGDDWENDIVPAAAVGIRTYWVAPETAVPPEPDLLLKYGSLAQLYELVKDGWLNRVG